jgi:transposase
MVATELPEEFSEIVAHHLPPEQPAGLHGGRPRIPDRIALRVIWFVLASGCRWADVPRELGCCGRTAHRRLRAWEEAGVWDRVHADLLRMLREAGKLDTSLAVIDSVIVRAFGGGQMTGPSPVDRRKPGTKLTVLVSRTGVPLVTRTAGANASDHTQLLPVVMKFPRVKGLRGRPREHPAILVGDRGYDSRATRQLLRWLGIRPQIAKRLSNHGSGLGRVRWVVERTISWLKGLRRLRVRYDRLLVIREAWTTLAASAICFNMLKYDVT